MSPSELRNLNIFAQTKKTIYEANITSIIYGLSVYLTN
jgi:hypothetical protein